MKTTAFLWECRRLLCCGRAIWLAALAVTACLQASAVHAQPHPPTIPNSNGSVTVRSSVGGPNAIGINIGGHQSGQFQQRQPAPMTFGPALNPLPSATRSQSSVPPKSTQPMTFAPALPPPPQQPSRIFYVYYRAAPELPWTCFGGYYTESSAQQSASWFRQRGSEAFYR